MFIKVSANQTETLKDLLGAMSVDEEDTSLKLKFGTQRNIPAALFQSFMTGIWEIQRSAGAVALTQMLAEVEGNEVFHVTYMVIETEGPKDAYLDLLALQLSNLAGIPFTTLEIVPANEGDWDVTLPDEIDVNIEADIQRVVATTKPGYYPEFGNLNGGYLSSVW
jgi:hypothetical protein